MLPIRLIVCPTDFSDPARRAVTAACELAGQFSAELLLLHVTHDLPIVAAAGPVMSPPGGAHDGFDVVGYQELIRKHAEEELDTLIDEEVAEEIRVRKVVLQGRPANLIVETAENEGADLIVISTHGRTGVRHFLFGSVAEKVVRSAACPVLTIHSAFAPEGE